MIRIPLNDMIEKIKGQTQLSDDEINAKIEDKCKQLSGLISKEGAAHIIANELGVKMLENSGKIKDIYPGMRSVEVTGKVTQVYDLKEFSRQDGSSGKVCSAVIGDETGTTRIVGWGAKADEVKTLKEGDIVRVDNAMVREGNRGGKEVHLNDQAKLQSNPPGIAIGEVAARPAAQRKALSDLTEQDQNVEVFGTILDVFPPRFFEVCPQCGKRMQGQDNAFSCAEHGPQPIDYSYVVNVQLDDSTGIMRVVLFRNQAEKLLNKTKEEMLAFREHPETFEQLKLALLGDQFRFIGRCKMNTFFNKLEFTANLVFKADAAKELERVKAQ